MKTGDLILVPSRESYLSPFAPVFYNNRFFYRVLNAAQKCYGKAPPPPFTLSAGPLFSLKESKNLQSAKPLHSPFPTCSPHTTQSKRDSLFHRVTLPASISISKRPVRLKVTFFVHKWSQETKVQVRNTQSEWGKTKRAG